MPLWRLYHYELFQVLLKITILVQCQNKYWFSTGTSPSVTLIPTPLSLSISVALSLSLCLSLIHSLTQTHTSHARTRARTHTHTHTRTRAHTHTLSLSQLLHFNHLWQAVTEKYQRHRCRLTAVKRACSAKIGIHRHRYGAHTHLSFPLGINSRMPGEIALSFVEEPYRSVGWREQTVLGLNFCLTQEKVGLRRYPLSSLPLECSLSLYIYIYHYDVTGKLLFVCLKDAVQLPA